MKRLNPLIQQQDSYHQDKDYRENTIHPKAPFPQITTTEEHTGIPQLNRDEIEPTGKYPPQIDEKDPQNHIKPPNLPDDFPTSLNSIKEYVAEKDGETYIPLHSTIVLKSRRRMLYLPLEFGEITMDGLVDSGAFINAMSWSDYNTIKMNSDNCVIKEYPQPPFKIECANAQLEQPIATADIQFNIGTYTFTDTFVILSKTSFPIIGLNFMRNHQAVIDTANGTINFPHVEMTLAMTDEMKKCNPKPLQIMVEGNQTLPPQQTTTVNAIVITTNMHDVTGAVQPLPQFDETATIIVAPALATAHNKRLNIRIANLTDFPHTIKSHTKLAELQILKPEDTKQIRPVDAAALKLLEDPDDTHMYVNELMKSKESEQNDENFWFPTPENPGNEDEHTPIQRRILKEIRELIQKEQLDPTKDQESRKKFLDMFSWEGSKIEGNDRKQLEETIVEYNDIFARHRLDIGINNTFKVKLTPKDERPIYTQSLPVPINLKEDLTVELALMHRYGIITTLPFSKYASPIFAQRKPNGKLRLLVDLRKINALISDDYINNNHPVSTLSDAAQHLAGKQLFCKLDCSQAYHCLQMADQRSIEMLAFNFASRTFAYKRLAQGLSRALSAFSSFIREYLDKVIKADQCAQYVDDIGVAANSVTQLIRNIRAVFECIRQAGLKLTIEKCHFGVTEIEFLGRTITSQGIAPQDHKIQKFLANVRFPKSKKQVQRYIGFANYYRNYIPRLSEKLLGFYELLKADKQIKVTEELLDHYKAINTALAEACGLALRQPITGRQYVLMTDASFRASGYALMIEEDPNKKLNSKKKTFAPVAFGSKVFSPAQLKMSIYCKEFLAIYHAFLEYSHILWETTLPTLVMTDNRSVTRFFQTKTIPPTLWNACDYVLQFNFHIMHVAGTQNTAADFLSRIDLNPKERVELKIRNDITVRPIQVNLQSTDVADEEQLFFLPEETIETEEEILLQKEQARQAARDEDSTRIKLAIKETNPIPINKASYTFGAIKEDARIRVEQDSDPVFKTIKKKLICEEYDKHLLQTDTTAKRLLVHENRLIVRDGILMRKYYGECGQVTHHQILIPEHLITELLKALHGQMGKHPGITKMIQECRSKYYYPGLAKRIKQWVTQCEDCIKYKRINNNQIRPKMINNTEHVLGPEDILEIDILPNLPNSSGYQNIVTMIDVFSRYLFAYPTQDVTAKTIGRCIVDVMTRHAYLPTLILSDKGSQFRSEIVAEITQILEIQISHASTKHAQTIGILERTHASIKTALKISTGERRSMWHKYVQIAVMNYNTTYHETLGCEPSTVFHGRIPYNVLDLKLGIKPKWKTTPNSNIADQLQKQIDEVRATAKDNIMLSYLKYKKYYDRKASAAPLKVNDYCYILNPKADNQSTKFAFQDCIWTGPYIVIKVLSNNNYTIRKIGTRYTQTLHRIRIRPYVPDQRIPDVTVRSNEYLPDPDVKISHNEWYAVSWEMDFGKQIDEQEPLKNVETEQRTEIQEVTNSDGNMSAPKSTEDTNEVNPPSPDFSNLTTDVGDNPYIRRPPPIQSPPIPPNSPPTVIGYNPRKTGKYNLRPNPKPNTDPDFRRLDAITLTQQ